MADGGFEVWLEKVKDVLGTVKGLADEIRPALPEDPANSGCLPFIAGRVEDIGERGGSKAWNGCDRCSTVLIEGKAGRISGSSRADICCCRG